MTSPADTAPFLEARGITMDFPGVRALDRVSFSARCGEIHALVGENGAGKSTLIKILGGIHPGDSYAGELLLEGRPAHFWSPRDAALAGIAVIHQELSLIPHLSVAENIFLGAEPRRCGFIADFDRMRHDAETILSGLNSELEIAAPVSSFGVAGQQMVEIARAIRRENRLLILDEPTASLSEPESLNLLSLLRRMRDRGQAVVYISHRLDEVLAVADRITVLRDGRVVGTGDRGDWTRERLICAMVGRDMSGKSVARGKGKGEPILHVRDVWATDPASGKRVVDRVSFDLHRGEILGVAGLMGSGRTELALTIFGAWPAAWGGAVWLETAGRPIRSVSDAIEQGVALVPEDRRRHGLVLGFPVFDNLMLVHLPRYAKAGVTDEATAARDARAIAGRLDIRAPSLQTPVLRLSGGNQQKIVAGKWLMRPPAVLLLDEPARGIDVGAKFEMFRIIRELADEGTAVLMISSELPEVLALSDRVLVMRRGRVGAVLEGCDATPERIMEAAV